jgi:diguanylate cyclase (GGDEF)-like protein
MRMRHKGFWLKIALPLLAAALGVYLLTNHLLTKVQYQANAAEFEHTQRVVNSAIIEKQRALTILANDNAYWDDAVKHVYGDGDKEWVEDTWRVPTEEGGAFQYMAVVERGNDFPIFSYLNGKDIDTRLSLFFKGKLGTLLADHDPKSEDRGAKSGIIMTEAGLAVVATSPITPTSEDYVGPTSPLRHLVIVQLLSPEAIAALGSQYVVDELQIVPPTEVAPIALKDPAGETIAAITWRAAKPGDAAYSSVINKALLALGFLAIVLVVTAYQCWDALTKLVRREEMAQHAATHDNLTGLTNRAALVAELAKIEKGDFTVVYADIDGFKDVNDTYDHNVGDSLIRFIAGGAIHLANHHGGTLSRIGGDEFVSLFKGENIEARAQAFAESFIAFLANPIEIDGRFATVGASIGIAHSKGGATKGAEVMRQGDIAMYEAKRAGKNQFVVYTADLDQHNQQNMALLNGLQQIIAETSLEVAFQPIVAASTSKMVAVEALARWPKHIQPHFTPDKFIHFAETHGMIGALGDTILRKTCEKAKNWHGLRISYNLSPVQLRDPKFVDRALAIINEYGITPSTFEFEVTEAVLVHDMGLVRGQLERLRAAGIHIALDDFGSGYSSVGYLQQLTFDRIKLDRSIIEHVASNSLDQGIAMGTVLMARGMGAVVTAEGIETEDQAVMLRAAGCSEFQGYHFHRPMADTAITTLLDAQNLASQTVTELKRSA